MKDIDFLPARYQEKSTKQKTQAWRGVVVAAFCALLAAGALGQFEIERELKNHLELVRQQYDKVVAEGDKLAELQRQLREARAEAELLTYLRHPWPRTQILARVVEPLNDAITLRKLEIKQEEAATARIAAPPPRQPPDEAAAAKEELPLAQRTINKLRDPLDDAPLTVTLEGISRESAALHVYLGKLAESDWFSAVELQSIERLEDGEAEGFRFAARLIVRPGYGHPSAPPLKRELAAHKDEQKPAGG
jgi:hypothetical protein